MNRLIIVMLIMIVFCVSCSPDTEMASVVTPNVETENVSQPTDAAYIPAIEFSQPGYHLIIRNEGDVNLKRSDWNDYYPTSFGTVLSRGDLVYPKSDSSLVVLCDDLSLWIVPSGIPSGVENGCPERGESVLEREDSLIGNTRGVSDLFVPYIISPRATLLSTSPTYIEWHPIPGVTEYTVRIQGLDWQMTTESTIVNLPEDLQLLENEWYLVIVEADNGYSSQDDSAPNLHFRILGENELAQINSDVIKLENLDLSPDEYTYALAMYYAGEGLFAESIDLLKNLVEQSGVSAFVYQELGVLYHQVGLERLAEEQFLIAIENYDEEIAPEGLAQTQYYLAEVYWYLGMDNRAIEWLESAGDGFEEIGAKDQLLEVEELLKKIE